MIVVDSSIALQWVLPEPESAQSRSYLGLPDSAAPDLILFEVANVLAKKVRSGGMTGDEAQIALSIVRDGIGRLIGSVPFAARALELSIALSHPVYDCVFLACAELVGGRLATRDEPFIKRATERGFARLLTASQ